MRTDVVFNTEVSDLELGGNKSPFSVLGCYKGFIGGFDQYEIDASSSSISEEDIFKGIYCILPIQYTTNDIKINIKYRFGNSEIIYETGYLLLKNTSGITLKSSDMQRFIVDFSQTSKVVVFIALNKESGSFVFYNGESVDLKTSESLDQNKDLILIANKSNLYNAQVIGVGLIDYLNSDLSDMKAIQAVIESFGIDNMTVTSMKINNDTGEIYLHVKEIKD